MVEIINNGGPKINHPKVCDLLKQICMFVRKSQMIHYTIHLDYQKIFLENPQMTLFFIFANNAILQM